MAFSTLAPPLLFQYYSITLSLLVLASSLHGATAAPPNTVVCNHKSYGDGEPFAVSLIQLLQELVLRTPWNDRGDLYDALPHTGALLAYGHAACLTVQLPDDCQACLRYAVKQILGNCGHSIGARATLVDCMVRYEQYAFQD